MVRSLRCCSCQNTIVHNFKWDAGRKLNIVSLGDIDALSVSDKLGFTFRYLKYHWALHFRGYTSTKAMMWAGRMALFGAEVQKRIDLEFENAKFLYLAMEVSQELNENHGQI